ncbi:MAG: hypothetical protein LLG00_02625 [Planctomycetaceae bacterium]|nr:hypothetical protein [Planctomycetaceae bacterium]
MKLFRIALFASLAACAASAAWAQYGLYGAPEPLRVPQQNPAPVYETPAYAPQGYQAAAYAAPAGYPTNYPTTAAPMAQPVAGPTYYQPSPTYSPYPPTQYRAAPQTTAMYQPYQTAPQYRNPNVYSRPTSQTMAAGQGGAAQTMPAPPAGPVAAAPAPVADFEYAPTPAPQGSGITNQMLAEQGGLSGDPSACSPYRGSLDRFERAACNPSCEGSSCDVGCQQACGCQWYAGISALALTRSDSPRLWTTYRDGHEETQLMNSQFGTDWSWGGEARFGRRFCCGCVPYAIEATYWTTEAITGERSCTWPGGYVSTPLAVNYIDFNGNNASNWFNGAEEHRLTRRDEFHNVELNLIREQLAWACDSPWDIGWSVGVRYFRFQEDLTFESRAQGCQWTDLGGVASLEDNVTNNLVGVQFGFDAAYCLFSGVRFFISPKVGLYDNIMDSDFRCATGDNIPGHTVYGYFPAHGTQSGISFLTQIDVGVDWQFSRCWSARAGYRVVAATGMALADSQFPQYVNDIPDIKDVRHTDSLVLHGAFLGITYNF